MNEPPKKTDDKIVIVRIRDSVISEFWSAPVQFAVTATSGITVVFGTIAWAFGVSMTSVTLQSVPLVAKLLLVILAFSSIALTVANVQSFLGARYNQGADQGRMAIAAFLIAVLFGWAATSVQILFAESVTPDRSGRIAIFMVLVFFPLGWMIYFCRIYFLKREQGIPLSRAIYERNFTAPSIRRFMYFCVMSNAFWYFIFWYIEGTQIGNSIQSSTGTG